MKIVNMYKIALFHAQSVKKIFWRETAPPQSPRSGGNRPNPRHRTLVDASMWVRAGLLSILVKSIAMFNTNSLLLAIL